MMIRFLPILSVTFFLALLTGCGGGGASQPTKQAEGAIKSKVPAGWVLSEVSIEKFSAGPAPNSLISTFSAKATPSEDMGVVLRTIGSTHVVRPVIDSKTPVGLYGKLAAEKMGDQWVVAAILDRAIQSKLTNGTGFNSTATTRPASGLQPISSLQPYVLEGSKEMDALLATMEEQKLVEARIRLAEQNAWRIAQEEEQAERDRKQREAREAALTERFDAITGANGCRLVHDGMVAWPIHLSAETKDGEVYTFSGIANDRMKMPKESVRFTGRIADNGALVLKLDNRSIDLVFEGFSSTGGFFSKQHNWTIVRMSKQESEADQRNAENLDKYLSQRTPELNMSVYGEHRIAGVLQSTPYTHAAGEMKVGENRGNKALGWIDGQLNTYWTQRDIGEPVTIRFKTAPKSKGILILGSDPYNGHFENVSARINGSDRIPLENVPREGQGFGNKKYLIKVDFDREVHLAEFELEFVGGRPRLLEVMVIDP